MFKNYLNRKTIYLCLAATAVSGFSASSAAPAAARVSSEVSLAGISRLLEENTAGNSLIVPSSVAATGSALTASGAAVNTFSNGLAWPSTGSALQNPASGAAATVATGSSVQAAGQEEKQKKSSKKKSKKVKKQFRAKAISIADNYVNIRKEPNTRSKIQGKLYKGSAANVIKTKGAWVKIESGNVTGYIKKSYLAIGAEAQKVAEKYGNKLVSVKKNVVTLNVREKKSTKSAILTQIPEDEMYEVAYEGQNWAKIIVDGDTKGFVAKEFVNVHIRFKKAVSVQEEQVQRARRRAAAQAEQQRLNTISSGQTGSSGRSGSNSSSGSANGSNAKATGSTGADIAQYAQNFVGNPYKWGGTSLTNGADCSGFVQSIYAQYGYSLPRTSREQSRYGKSVSLSQVQPGDLIFYKHGSTVGHVAMYIGGGRVVHAASSRQGIIISNMNYNQPYCAKRIV